MAELLPQSAYGELPNGQFTRPDWKNIPPSLYAPVADIGINSILYQWGPLQFTVFPLNIGEVDHETSTDWAKKEIAGAAIYREWVGENDEILHIRGKLFPYRIGGMAELEVFEVMRRTGVANLMMRGHGEKLGWFVCEHLIRSHTYLSAEGIGQQIAFEAQMARVPVPDSATYFSSLWPVVAAP